MSHSVLTTSRRARHCSYPHFTWRGLSIPQGHSDDAAVSHHALLQVELDVLGLQSADYLMD